jgi:hypothetical protein
MPLPVKKPPKQITYIEIAVLLAIFGIAIFLNNSGFRFDLRLRAYGTPANIIVSTTKTLTPFPTGFYHAFAQGGEEKTDMLSPVVSAVQTLKPNYIRIDHIFDSYGVVQKENGILTFDFTKLDRTVDTIRKTGAIPVFSLSYMPPAIAKDGNITNPPNNWNDWTQVVRETIQHYSGSPGKNLTGVYYEVWNEPDLAQFGGWKTYGNKNYLVLYKNAALGADTARNVNTFYFGGPATTALYKDWITPLIKTGYRLDFISWHTYNTDPRHFSDDQHNLSEWLKGYPQVQHIPTLITEFGFTGAKDERFGTTYASAYTAAVIRQLIMEPPKGLFTFELKDGPGAAGDGWGILPHESVGGDPKPRYQVFSLLDDLSGTMLAVSGEGTWVTALASSRSNTIRTLLVNFHPDGNHSENVPVTFTGLVPGQYAFRQHQLAGVDATIRVTIPAQTWQTHIFMPPNAVTLVSLTRF